MSQLSAFGAVTGHFLGCYRRALEVQRSLQRSLLVVVAAARQV